MTFKNQTGSLGDTQGKCKHLESGIAKYCKEKSQMLRLKKGSGTLHSALRMNFLSVNDPRSQET
jgi:hypothetical protein